MFFAWKTAEYSIAVSWNEFAEIFGGGKLPGNMWAPPIIGSSDDMAGILWLAASFLFITLIPKAVDITKMLIMGAKFDLGSAIGEAAGAFGVLPMAQKTGGQFISDQIYNPRADSDIIRTLKGKWDNRANSKYSREIDSRLDGIAKGPKVT